jgi:hypothetical protein
MAAIGAFSMAGALAFDYPLRLVEVVYAAKGLTPYVDFGFVYPPGQVWFYGKLLRLQDPGVINAAITLGNLLLVSICAWQVMRLTPGWRRLFGGTVLLVLGGAMPVALQSFDLEPIILLLIAVLLVEEVMERGSSAARLSALVGVAVVGTLFRWDWILPVAVLEAGWAAVIWLIVGILNPDQSILVRRIVARLWRAALAALAGGVLAMAVIVGHALATGTWADTRLFIFNVPVLTLPFRRLPLPVGIHLPTVLWLVDIIAMALIALAASLDYVKSRPGFRLAYLLKGGALLAPCVILLPYTFTRADGSHFVPFSMLVMVTSMAAFTIWRHRAARSVLLIVLVMTAVPYLYAALRGVFEGSVQKVDIHLQRVHKLTAECSSIFPRDARSLFVGQISYNRFIINSPIFYLIRPDLRPATPFISDEPGVQNSCTLGSRIATDLIRAPRPLILVLDTQPYSPEPNLTRTMTSCGKIEAAIAAMPAVVLGTCQVREHSGSDTGRIFRVMAVR